MAFDFISSSGLLTILIIAVVAFFVLGFIINKLKWIFFILAAIFILGIGGVVYFVMNIFG